MDFQELYPFACCNAIRVTISGSSKDLQSLISHGKPTNSKDNRGWRALHHAAYQNNLECLQILLKAKDVDVNAQTFEGETALTLACRNIKGRNPRIQTETVKCLLKKKADPNIPSMIPWKLTLNEAIESQNIEVLKLLMKYKVDVNDLDDCYGTPLFAAIQQGSVDAIILLLNNDALTGKQGPYDLTPLHCIFAYGKHDLNLLKLLISHQKIKKNINERDMKGSTPLNLACMCNWGEGVKVLLSKNADPNIHSFDGSLPLYNAAEEFDDQDVLDEDSAFCQLAKSTNLESICTQYKRCEGKAFWSLFHMLLRKNKLQMLKYFLKMDLKPDSFSLPVEIIPYSAIPFWDKLCSFSCLSPLSYVCFLCDNEEKVNLAQLLISQGSTVNCVTPEHLPPAVTLSSQSKRPKSDKISPECHLMKLLLEYGADVLYKTRPSDPLPAAYLLSYHTKENSILWFLLHNCVPAGEIFTQESFSCLKLFYEEFPNHYSANFILKRFEILDIFIPLLPFDVWTLFDISREELQDCFKKRIDNPKSLLHLSALAVRSILWQANKIYLFKSIGKLCSDLALPNAVKDILFLKHQKFS